MHPPRVLQLGSSKWPLLELATHARALMSKLSKLSGG